MAPKLRSIRQAKAASERRALFPPRVQLAVAVILCAVAALGAGICFLAIDGGIARWLFVAGGVLGVVGLVLARRYRITARTKADDQPPTR